MLHEHKGQSYAYVHARLCARAQLHIEKNCQIMSCYISNYRFLTILNSFLVSKMMLYAHTDQSYAYVHAKLCAHAQLHIETKLSNNVMLHIKL